MSSQSEDPRIKARRSAVEQAKVRRRTLVVGSALCVGVVVFLVYLLLNSALLEARKLEVTGVTGERGRAVEVAAAVPMGDALAFLDTGAISDRVKKLPWIASVSVKTQLPHTVSIELVERNPVAWVRPGSEITITTSTSPNPSSSTRNPSSESSTTSTTSEPTTTTTTRAPAVQPPRLVDKAGRVLATTAAPPFGIPEIRGVKVAKAGGFISPKTAATTFMALPKALRVQVAVVEVDRVGSVVLLLNTTAGQRPTARVIRIGPPDNARTKGNVALAVLEALRSNRQSVTTIDVTVPTAPATS
ncbi:MAG: FtsQ-type POTRA domain-containing protein [Actinomycetes bacterium]